MFDKNILNNKVKMKSNAELFSSINDRLSWSKICTKFAITYIDKYIVIRTTDLNLC